MSQLVEMLLNLGLGKPAQLDRNSNGPIQGDILLGGSSGAGCVDAICRNLATFNTTLHHYSRDAELLRAAAGRHGLQASSINPDDDSLRLKALIFDATGIADTEQLLGAYQFFQPALRKLASNGRVLILTRPHREADGASQAAAQRGLEGLSRSLAKEIGKKGATAQLICVAKGAEDNIDSALRFILSPRSAYVNAQVFRIESSAAPPATDGQQPLKGSNALVTGASRGIGEAIARTLAREGATVLGVDIEATAEDLQRVMADIDGQALIADITADDAPAAIADKLQAMGGAHIVVHNAGITRDKTLANMPEHWWTQTVDINLGAALRINDTLLNNGVLTRGGRIIGVSSMNGIAGQRGQSNYATSKAGVIGYVEYLAPKLAEQGITVNAVAPGFIETQMTAAIPLMTREVGRRLNSLSQGGQPEDVAETIAFFANPASSGVNGNIIRVCGQSWLGA